MFSLLKVDHSDCKATLRSLVEEPTRLFYGVRDEYFSSNIFGDLEEINYFCSMNDDNRNKKKQAGLKTGSQHLAETYGEKGTPSREEFEAKAKAWYYAELLRDERKRQKLTQQQLGERIGKKREYISSLEQGQTDMQLSTFMLIANALGLRFSLVVG